MSRKLRVLVVAGASVLALAVTSTAMAAFVPRLSVSHGTMGLNQEAVDRIRVTVPRDDDALFRAVIYAPPGYTYNFTQSAGIQVGTVNAQVQVREPVAGAVIPLNGTIVTDAPGNHVNNQCAPGMHFAVWLLQLQSPAGVLTVPVYIDIASQAETSFASFKMTICLPSPHIPQSVGGAALGAKLIQAQLNVNSVRAPTRAGMYTWRLIATPWRAPATPAIAETVEARALIGFPSVLSLNLRVTNRARRVVQWSGRLTEAGEPIAGVRVQMWRGGQARGRAAAPLRLRVQKTTNRNGVVSGTLRFKRAGTVLMQLRVTVPERVEACPALGAQNPTPTPRGCVSQTRAFFSITSPVRRLVLR